MWNSWIDKGREIAERAKQAAEQIEGQLDASVGAPVPSLSVSAVGAGAGAGAAAAAAGAAAAAAAGGGGGDGGGRGGLLSGASASVGRGASSALAGSLSVFGGVMGRAGAAGGGGKSTLVAWTPGTTGASPSPSPSPLPLPSPSPLPSSPAFGDDDDDDDDDAFYDDDNGEDDKDEKDGGNDKGDKSFNEADQMKQSSSSSSKAASRSHSADSRYARTQSSSSDRSVEMRFEGDYVQTVSKEEEGEEQQEQQGDEKVGDVPIAANDDLLVEATPSLLVSSSSSSSFSPAPGSSSSIPVCSAYNRHALKTPREKDVDAPADTVQPLPSPTTATKPASGTKLASGTKAEQNSNDIDVDDLDEMYDDEDDDDDDGAQGWDGDDDVDDIDLDGADDAMDPTVAEKIEKQPAVASTAVVVPSSFSTPVELDSALKINMEPEPPVASSPNSKMNAQVKAVVRLTEQALPQEPELEPKLEPKLEPEPKSHVAPLASNPQQELAEEQQQQQQQQRPTTEADSDTLSRPKSEQNPERPAAVAAPPTLDNSDAAAGAGASANADIAATSSIVNAATAPPPPSPQNTAVDPSILQKLIDKHNAAMSLLQTQLQKSNETIKMRESQLESKTEQLSSMFETHTIENDELKSKIRDTKDEAKRRILRARERCEEMEIRLRNAESKVTLANMDSIKKDEIIDALRKEGEKLAMKQSQMEQRVREAGAEARELASDLEKEAQARAVAEARASDLETKLKKTRDDLNDARKGETRAGKLDMELISAREESERKSGQILMLEQQVKELKSSLVDAREEINSIRKAAAAETERTSSELRRERDDLLSDLESKLRTLERDAAAREDALRHEVGEIRRRWQDAVRRADELSMDAQQSSAPLMRQIESAERQNRARAAAWAELEMRLRNDVEERVVQVDRLTKERNELRVAVRRLERVGADRDEELVEANRTIEKLTDHVETLEGRVSELEDEGRKIKDEWVEVERRADEGVAKVRTEMMQTVLDSEERYRAQITNLEREVREERAKRAEMEGRLADLAESSGMMIQQTLSGESTGGPIPGMAKHKRLKSATDQAGILRGAMAGLDGYDDDDDDDDDDYHDDASGADMEGEFEGKGRRAGSAAAGGAIGSFAAMEQLSQGLRGARLELDALRGQLASSEEVREGLLAELAETRAAAEKLPLFEARVAELTREVEEKDLEILSLRDDIIEVRMMYRGQLDALLEEKAMSTPIETERKVNDPAKENGAQVLDE